MANTSSSTYLFYGKRRTVVYFKLASDGSEETDLVIYDSSAVATQLGITDPLMCSVNRVWSMPSAHTNARFFLEFDASTDVLALPIPQQNESHQDYTTIGGLKNTAGSGITGDITLTTTNLDSGDSLAIVLEILVG